MNNSRGAQEMMELMELVDEVDINERKEPDYGSEKASGRDVSTDKVAKMLQYMQNIVSSKQIKSWKYGQDWLNQVDKVMHQFLDLKNFDPSQKYVPGAMGADMHAGKYTYNNKKYTPGSASAEERGHADNVRWKSAPNSEDHAGRSGLNRDWSREPHTTRTDYNK